MMKVASPFFFAAVILFTGLWVNDAYAELCGADPQVIAGEFSTFSLGNNTLGTLEGKCVNRKKVKFEGAIHGQILQQPDEVTVISQHILAMPGRGLLFTGPEVLTILGPDPESPCRYLAQETIQVQSGTGEFLGCSGTGFAEGTIDFCTGENEFEFTVEITCN